MEAEGIFDYDRSKLIFSARKSSLTGKELYQISCWSGTTSRWKWRRRHYVLAITSAGDTEEGLKRLCEAIEEIDRKEAAYL